MICGILYSPHPNKDIVYSYLSIGVSYCSIQLPIPLLGFTVGCVVDNCLLSSGVARHDHVSLLRGEKWVWLRCYVTHYTTQCRGFEFRLRQLIFL